MVQLVEDEVLKDENILQLREETLVDKQGDSNGKERIIPMKWYRSRTGFV